MVSRPPLGIASRAFDCKVEDHEVELRRVGKRLPQIGLQLRFHPHMWADRSGEEVSQPGHDRVRLDRRRRKALAAREGKQLSGKLAAALRRLQRISREPAQLFIVGASKQQIQRAHHGSEEIVENHAQSRR